MEEVKPESGKENDKLYAKESGDPVMDILLDMLFITIIQLCNSFLIKTSSGRTVTFASIGLLSANNFLCSISWEESCLEDYE